MQTVEHEVDAESGGIQSPLPHRYVRLDRRSAGKTEPWEDVLQEFESFVGGRPKYKPLMQLVLGVAEAASLILHGRIVIGGRLLLSLDEELHWNDNILMISFDPRKAHFVFEYLTLSGRNDFIECAEGDEWKTLRLFVGYKFGHKLPELNPTISSSVV